MHRVACLRSFYLLLFLLVWFLLHLHRATNQAEKVLALDPGIPGEQPRVWVYRNTIKALNWFASVREKLDDPAYSGWFVRFANYIRGNGSYYVPACTFEKCSRFYHDQEQTPGDKRRFPQRRLP
jgi:hypothetical protein